ncbi:3-deoxy-7-phosphoheptulonate synthase AroG [Oligella ureolytica]
MSYNTDDLRIAEIRELTPPSHLMREYPCSSEVSSVVHGSRQAIHDILHDKDDRILVVVGLCSIHDTKAALEYADLLNIRPRAVQG